MLNCETKRRCRVDVNALSRQALILGCLVFLSCAHSVAQQAGETQDKSSKLEVEINRVLVPVVVRDKQGQAVGDLKQEDFRVFDNNKPHSISGFTVEKHGVAESSTQASKESGAQPPAIASGVQASAAASPASRRYILFLFDDLHLNFEEMVHARDASMKVLQGVLTDSDIAAVITTSGRVNSGLTRDRAKLQDALMTLKSLNSQLQNKSQCPNIGYYEAYLIEGRRDNEAYSDALQRAASCCPDVVSRESSSSPNLNAPMSSDPSAGRVPVELAAQKALSIGLQDVLTTDGVIASVVRKMAELPGQRELILVSPGFLTIEPEAFDAESRIVDLAAQSNVTINALDARGLYATNIPASEKLPGDPRLQSQYRSNSLEQDGMTMGALADGTGGTFFEHDNDLEGGLKRLMEVPDYVYLLELPLNNMKPDGSYHSLKVDVDRDGLQLQARRGYFLPKPEKKKK
jgi:VWFA-related protein